MTAWHDALGKALNREFWDLTAFVELCDGGDKDQHEFFRTARKGYRFGWEVVQANPPTEERWLDYRVRLESVIDREVADLLAERKEPERSALQNGIARLWRTMDQAMRKELQT